jgi:hypothetical protein
MAPTGGELEGFAEIGVEREFEGGEEGPLGGEADGGFSVKEFGESAANCCGLGEQRYVSGKWDARPIAEKSTGVLCAVLRGVHNGNSVVEDLFRLRVSIANSHGSF